MPSQNITTLSDVPAALRPLVRIIARRDELAVADVWTDCVQPALTELDAALSSGDYIDESEFMSEHFGLEPDYFITLLTHLS